MRFLVVEDARPVLREETELLKEVVPGCQVFSCTGAKEALEYAAKELLHVAFLDIELGGSHGNGILLAKQLKDMQPHIHIVFVTAFSQYAVEAFSIHATGYLLKPVQKEHLKRELTFIYGEEPDEKKRVRVQTFGNFEVWVDGEILIFGRKKSKELFAYLVERKGACVTTREACAVLFEDENYDRTKKSYFQTIVADMRNTFKKKGLEDIIWKSYNSLAVNVEEIDCDYYRFLAGDAKVIDRYNGEFMMNYSWAEFSIAALEHKMKEMKNIN